MGWTVGVLFPAGAEKECFSLRHRVQTSSGTRPASCAVGTRGVKLTTQLHLVPRVRIRGALPPLPHKSSVRFMVSGLAVKTWRNGHSPTRGAHLHHQKLSSAWHHPHTDAKGRLPLRARYWTRVCHCNDSRRGCLGRNCSAPTPQHHVLRIRSTQTKLASVCNGKEF
jgi:hypothetical protein